MKIRNGFVSNSSSSSFTCIICGCERTGFEMGLRDLGYCSSCDDETVCESCVIDHVKKFKLEKEFEDFKDLHGSNWQCVPLDEKLCPINCNFITKQNMFRFLLKETNQSLSDVTQKMLSKFKNISEFRDYLKK